MDGSITSLRKLLTIPTSDDISVADIEAAKRILDVWERKLLAAGTGTHQGNIHANTALGSPQGDIRGRARRGRPESTSRTGSRKASQEKRNITEAPAPKLPHSSTPKSSHARGLVSSYPFVDTSRDTMSSILYPTQAPAEVRPARTRSRPTTGHSHRQPAHTADTHGDHGDGDRKARKLMAQWQAIQQGVPLDTDQSPVLREKSPVWSAPRNSTTQQARRETASQTASTTQPVRTARRGRSTERAAIHREPVSATNDEPMFVPATDEYKVVNWIGSLRSTGAEPPKPPRTRSRSGARKSYTSTGPTATHPHQRSHVPEYATNVAPEWAAVGSVFAEHKGSDIRAYELPGAAASKPRPRSQPPVANDRNYVVPRGGGVPRYLRDVKSRIAADVANDRFHHGSAHHSPHFSIYALPQQHVVYHRMKEREAAFYEGNTNVASDVEPQHSETAAEEKFQNEGESRVVEQQEMRPQEEAVDSEHTIEKPEGKLLSNDNQTAKALEEQPTLPADTVKPTVPAPSTTKEEQQQQPHQAPASAPNSQRPAMRAAIAWAVPTAELNKKVDVYGVTDIPQHRPKGMKPAPRPKEPTRDVRELIPSDLPMLDVTVNVQGFKRFIPRADPIDEAPRKPLSPTSTAATIRYGSSEGVLHATAANTQQQMHREEDVMVSAEHTSTAAAPNLRTTGPPEALTLEQKARAALDALVTAVANSSGQDMSNDVMAPSDDRKQFALASVGSEKPFVTTLVSPSRAKPASRLPLPPSAVPKATRKVVAPKVSRKSPAKAQVQPQQPQPTPAREQLSGVREPHTNSTVLDADEEEEGDALSIHSLPDELAHFVAPPGQPSLLSPA